MIRKSFVFILLIVIAGATALAQDTPESDKLRKSIEEKVNAAVLSSVGGSGYLGVYMQEVTKENFSKYGLSDLRGVAISKVVEDSPAHKAGIKDNDVVIGFNGELVTSVRKLRRLIYEVAPDHSARVTVLRDGGEQNFDVKIGRTHEAIFRNNGNLNRIHTTPNVFVPRMPRVGKTPRVRVYPNTGRLLSKLHSRTIGIRLTPVSKQLGNYFGVSDGQGLLVSSVIKGSSADKAGLKAGDVIVEANGKKVKNTFDLLSPLNKKEEGDINLTIVRDKKRQTITVTPEKSKNSRNFDFENDFESFEKIEN